MNTQSYRQLIQLLSIAIKNQEGNTVLAQPINWEQVYKYAQAHQIEGLLYTTIQQLPYREDLPKELLETWKRIRLLQELLNIFILSKLLKYSRCLMKLLFR